MKNKAWILSLLVTAIFAAPLPEAGGDSMETAGDVLSLLLPLTGYTATFFHHDPEGRRQFEKSFLTSTITTYGLKAVIDHHGPNGSSHSFPSGHSALAFAGASFLQQRYGLPYGLPAYLTASLVGYSRVESNHHHWEDVATSAGLSICSSLFFVRPFIRKITLTALVGPHCRGLAMVGRF